MRPERHKAPRPPLDQEALERLAIFYVGRYATTQARLRTYLVRKVRERGWDGAGPDIDALIGRLAGLGYIDDAAFALSRAASLQRRGYGERRVSQALHAAGIDEDDAAPATAEARSGAMTSALRFAERKRIGPYAPQKLEREPRQRAFGAMMRAGHSPGVARRVLDCAPGEFPESDDP